MATPDERQRMTSDTDAMIAYSFGDQSRIALLRALSEATGALTMPALAMRSQITPESIGAHLAPLMAAGVIAQGGARTKTFRITETPLAQTIRAMARATIPSEMPPSVSYGTFDAIFDQVNSGVLLYDASGNVVRVNAAAERITQRAIRTGESVGMRADINQLRDASGNRVSTDDSPPRRALKGEAVAQMEYIITGARGQDIWLRASAAPLRDAQGTIDGAIVIFDDITDQLAVRHEEVRQRSLANAMIEQTFSGMAIFDAMPDYRCLKHNENFFHLYGGPERFPQGTLVGLTLDDIFEFEKESLDAIRAIYERVCSTGEPYYSSEFQVVRLADRQERWYLWRLSPLRDDAGNITQLLSVILETTAIVQARDNSRRAAQELRTVIESLPEAVILSDSTGQIILSNAAASRIVGRDGQTDVAAGGHATSFTSLAPDGRRLHESELPLVRALHGETVVGEETIYEHADGQRTDLLISSAPVIHDNSGRIAGAVAVFQDITNLKELERQRDDFLGIAAHELRTPLATILATLQAFQRRMLNSSTDPAIPSETLSTGIERMLRQAQRLNLLVTDLLDATRIRTGMLVYDLEPCDFANAVRDAVVGQISANLGRNITLSVPKEPVMVMGDSFRLSQVVDNLVANALKYSQDDLPVLVSLTVEGDTAFLSVTDKGVGIPPESIEHLFDRFYRVPGVDVQYGPRVGLGLGLHITRTLVERHGGHIEVISQQGVGTTFIVTLPVLKQSDSLHEGSSGSASDEA